MAKKVLVPIANGTEEMEAVILIDMFRRAGLDVTIAGEDHDMVCSRGVILKPEKLIKDISSDMYFDAVVLPGGAEGTRNLGANSHLISIMENTKNQDGIIGAICAAPKILSDSGFLEKGSKATSHPSVKNELGECEYTENRVERHGNVFTSRGTGTAFEFASAIISELVSKEKSEEILEAIIYK
ncbi:MAG: DJ-1 family glyoxalase III [Bacteroidota bacterium]